MAQPPRDAGDERLLIHNLARAEARRGFAEDVRRGLAAAPKFLLPKYFYDELGSRLFEAICLLPEYYPTRAENEILERAADEIVEAAAGASPVALVELGSGSASKTRRLIEALLERQERLLYVPVDISTAALEESARLLLQSYTRLRVTAYAGDYESALPHLRDDVGEDEKAFVLFLGSNIGNFDRGEARAFLRSVREVLRAGDALLLGADLKKDPALLEAAYDDALGVTAAFNLNLLSRINREFEADFDLRAFRHVAVYNEREGRVEMYIESRRAQEVRVRALDMNVRFEAGERMHTENSYKSDADELSSLAAATGFTLARAWLDRAGQFSSNLFVANADQSAHD
ncbi:MAG TPA: L-histidine N(alpha)-methyltransferase [Pyrinomonadaceae bacterium]|jgi:dimethylhistidine N-methyltransferase|nr:L-histidine N(alpha)-methyltransferase [Pyrinomonadaceae bacterium]